MCAPREVIFTYTKTNMQTLQTNKLKGFFLNKNKNIENRLRRKFVKPLHAVITIICLRAITNYFNIL